MGSSTDLGETRKPALLGASTTRWVTSAHSLGQPPKIQIMKQNHVFGHESMDNALQRDSADQR